jgi:hypothetical protein
VTDEPVLRIATFDDQTAVDALMKESAAVLFPRLYDERQSASAVRYVLPDGVTVPCVAMRKPIEP